MALMRSDTPLAIRLTILMALFVFVLAAAVAIP